MGHRIQNYEKYFNRVTKRRQPDKLNNVFNLYKDTAEIFLAGGFPNSVGFPIKEMHLRLRDGRTVDISEEEMTKAQQYGGPQILQLKQWLLDHQKLLHNPPTMDPSSTDNSAMDLLMSNGSQDAMFRVIMSVLDEGDYIITEDYTYSSTLDIVSPIGCNVLPIKSDPSGMIPSDLDEKLSSWNVSANGRRPQLLYCVPVGGNPTGNSWNLERKKQIYSLARKYELLIFEDDAYYMLHYTRLGGRLYNVDKALLEEFINVPLLPSLLSLDVDGRVLRGDSFSKVMAPGVRLGYLSGPRQFLQKVQISMQTSPGSANTVAQIIVYKVLERMGHDGFIEQGNMVCKFNKERCEMVLRAAEKHVKGLAEWSSPAGGMFLWLKVVGVDDSVDVCERAAKKGVVFSHGEFFSAEKKTSPYIRINFSYVTEEKLDKAFRRLRDAILEHNQAKGQ